MDNLSINYKNIVLVTYEKKYFEYIYNCYQDYGSIYLFTNDMLILSKEKLWNILNKKMQYNYHEFMIVINNSTNLPIGFIYSYDYNINNQYLYSAIFIDKTYRNTIYGANAGIAFFEHLFRIYPIRKIYCTVYDYNKNSMNFLTTAGFVKEGVLKEHHYFDGIYYNMNIMALYRNNLYELLEKVKFKK